MVKKSVTKKAVPKESSKKVASLKSAKSDISDKGLRQNFLALQKVMVVQSVKIDKLTTQISGLLDLFSASAKALAKKEFGSGNSEEIVKLNSKIDELLFNSQKIIGSATPQAPEPMYSPSIETSAPVSVPAVVVSQPVSPQVPPQVQAVGNPMTLEVPQVPQIPPVQDAQGQATQGSGKPVAQGA